MGADVKMIKTVTKHYIDAETVRDINKILAEKDYEITCHSIEADPPEHICSPDGWSLIQVSPARRTVEATLKQGQYEITIKKVL